MHVTSQLRNQGKSSLGQEPDSRVCGNKKLPEMLTGKREKGQSAWARRECPAGGVASGGRSPSGGGA